MMKRVTIFIVIVLSLQSGSLRSQSYKSTWESIDSRPVPAWFEDAKFGIFIHWGLYSVPAYSPTAKDKIGTSERYAEHYWRWIETDPTQNGFKSFHNRVYSPGFKYQDFAGSFKAELFQPDEWAARFKDAGAQYVVLTSKHHDGFTLWPSKLAANWNAVDIGPHRNLLGDLTSAVRKSGIKMGLYYSLLEWYHPLYKKAIIANYVEAHMIPQMKELVTEYKPDILWTDGDWDHTAEDMKSTQFLQWLYNDSPVKDYVVVNDRWGKGTRGKHGGFYTTEYDLANDENTNAVKFERPWEECRGIAGSFGYNRNELLEDYSTSEELVHILINKVARGGNLLLNIGPTADGRIPVIQQQRLSDIGKWLRINGDAIYGSRKWDGAPAVTPATTQYFTKKGNDLYLILTKWPEKPIVIENAGKPGNINLLGYSGKVEYSFKGNKLTIIPPVITPANIPCQYAWVFKIDNVIK